MRSSKLIVVALVSQILMPGVSLASDSSTSLPISSQSSQGQFDSCGGAANVPALAAPRDNLCLEGTPSHVSGVGPWHWTCSGAARRYPSSCSAPVASEEGQCGAANSLTGLMSAPTSDLCEIGKPSVIRGNGPWVWSCKGNNGIDHSCYSAPGGLSTIDMRPKSLGLPNGSRITLAVIQSQIASYIKNYNNTDQTIVLHFPAGIYDFSQDTSINPKVVCQTGDVTDIPNPQDKCPQTVAIDLTGVSPGPHGRLILLGDGPAMTTFITNPDQTQILGNRTSRVSFVGIHFALDRLDASQGHIVYPQPATGNPTNLPSSEFYVVDVDIPNGFPSLALYPQGLWNPSKVGGNGRYLRRFSADSRSCQIDITSPQNSFDGASADTQVPNRFWLHGNIPQTFPYANGDLVGIKSDAGLGEAYTFYSSHDVMFDDILWTGRSRGAFYANNAPDNGKTTIQIYDSSIRKRAPLNGEPICMSSSAGGPQIGQGGSRTWNNVVENFFAENTGDDSLAAFESLDPNGEPGTRINNVIIMSSFARSIGLYGSTNPVPPGIMNVSNPAPDSYQTGITNYFPQQCSDISLDAPGSDPIFSSVCLLLRPGDRSQR